MLEGMLTVKCSCCQIHPGLSTSFSADNYILYTKCHVRLRGAEQRQAQMSMTAVHPLINPALTR